MNEDQGFDLHAEQRYRGAGKKAPGGGWLKGAATVILGLVVVGGGLGAGGYWFYNQGQPAQQEGKLPILLPDPTPVKLRPDDPGGMEVPHRDTTIYEQLDDSQPEDPVVLQELPDMPKAPEVMPSSDDGGETDVADGASNAETSVGQVVTETASASSASKSEPAAESAPETATSQTTASIKAPEIAAPSYAEKAIAAAKEKQQAAVVAAPATPVAAKANVATGKVSEQDFRIQLASVRDASGAESEWKRLSSKNKDLLGNLQMFVQRTDLGDKGVFYRLQAGPLANAGAAETLCGNLKQRNVGCLIVRP
tara:strand:- start:25935 stop:26861 length:927 start_codon:yes stop_codon:yes gene_type:complete